MESRTLSQWLKEHYKIVWWTSFTLTLMPFVSLVYRYKTEQLGINTLETLVDWTGQSALILLIITLTITPLRRFLASLSKKLQLRYGKRLADWNWIIRLRKMIGNMCFFYAFLHALVYFNYDLGWEFEFLIEDLSEKKYIFLGMTSLLLLSALSITSTRIMIKKMGRNWKKLHRLVYLIIILVLAHFWWLTKVGVYDPLPYTIIVLFLLGYRLLSTYGFLLKRQGDNGMEVEERPPYVPKNKNIEI